MGQELKRRRFAARAGLVLAASAMAAVSPADVAADPLRPHRAVYDVTLSAVEPSASIVEASGRLVFELSGDACEGYAVNSRFVTRVVDREGNEQVTDLRSATFETITPPTFAFVNRTFLNDRLGQSVKGRAEARASGVVVTIEEPAEKSLTLKRAVFPTQHTRLIRDAARAGGRVLEIPVYDGGDNADVLYDTTTVIGPVRTGLPDATETERAALQAVDGAADESSWRLVISYFEADAASGEPVPEYEISFTMLESGISYDVSFAYGSFALSGKLTELELLDAGTEPCPD